MLPWTCTHLWVCIKYTWALKESANAKINQDPVLACSQTAFIQFQLFLVPNSRLWNPSTLGTVELVFLWIILSRWIWVSPQILRWTWLLWHFVLPQVVWSSHLAFFLFSHPAKAVPSISEDGGGDTLDWGYQQSNHYSVRQRYYKTWPNQSLDIYFLLGEEWIH